MNAGINYLLIGAGVCPSTVATGAIAGIWPFVVVHGP